MRLLGRLHARRSAGGSAEVRALVAEAGLWAEPWQRQRRGRPVRRWEETPKRAWGAEWSRGKDHNATALVAAVLPRSHGDEAGGWLMAAPDLFLRSRGPSGFGPSTAGSGRLSGEPRCGPAARPAPVAAWRCWVEERHGYLGCAFGCARPVFPSPRLRWGRCLGPAPLRPLPVASVGHPCPSPPWPLPQSAPALRTARIPLPRGSTQTALVAVGWKMRHTESR